MLKDEFGGIHRSNIPLFLQYSKGREMLCNQDTHAEFRAMIRTVFLIEALQMLCRLYEDSYASSVKYRCPFLADCGLMV